jgi:hypothetical protein
VVLPHQPSLGDSSSLSDSLCRTGGTRFYSEIFFGWTVGIKCSSACLPLCGCGREAAITVVRTARYAHFERLYNFACWLTHDRQEAEDLMQETYAKALKGFPFFSRVQIFAPGPTRCCEMRF